AGPRIEHRHLVVAAGEEGLRANLDLAIFSAKTATLQVIDNPQGNDSLGTVMSREHSLAGINGGYFDPEFAPVGLSISDGRLVRPQQRAKLLSGVVSAKDGRVVIQRTAEFSMKSKPAAARQCGPFLVESGQPIAGLNNEREARRTFVSVSGDRAMLGFCSSVTLAQLAEILCIPDLKISRALNMDGGSSSAFWFGREKGPLYISEQKNVRDFLAIAPQPAKN
ncbi:MAG: phosphodiester glycosidase family protein, partial [Verrucomicrobiota bacterium]|nr:phosphodiester glycosidase family protein [Verrucomicrobiota bacterium]